MAPWLPGQNSATDKIYKQLAAIPIHSKIEVRLTTGTRIRGELLSFDRAEVQMSGQAAPIALSDIRSVKRLDQSSGRKWNPIWGISGSWKTAAIAGGMLLLLGIVAAKNTR